MDFAFDAPTEELRERLLTFMDQRVYPAEPILAEQLAAPRDDPWETTGVIEELKVEARRRGLWNL
ncbi:MAG TPA: acyl-CoA dehydrogenase, partial [Kineosporiaceae bacterium]|nr:acyl-CoA dehydrogenase [Kineosporiaceae bacterium]